MTRLLLAFLLALLVSAALHALTATCFLKRERLEGKYKICYYDCYGDEVAVTIRATQYCAYKITVP